MPSETIPKLKKIIKELSLNPTLSDMNTIENRRMSYIPPSCSIFEKKYLATKSVTRYKFKTSMVAKEQLSKITDGRVLQLFEGKQGKSKLIKKKKVAILFSGGPSPGGHNVIAGLFDALKKTNPNSSLLGFIMGFDGLIEGNYIEITHNLVDQYRNHGGFNMIGTSRTKIDSIQKIYMSKQTLKKLNLDAVVVVGGDDSNTNAAFLAQEMFDENISVIGVPKTIDGDIQIKDLNGKILCPISFGFHTASRVFSHLISNLCVDAESDGKYWHICKVMGRSASHIALEVALQTQTNLTLIGEELADYVDKDQYVKIKQKGNTDFSVFGMTLDKLVRLISDIIVKRAKVGKKFGVIVIPEGILEFINEIQIMMLKLSRVIADYDLNNYPTFHDTFETLDRKLDYLKNTTSLHPVWNIKDNELLKNMPILLQEGLLTDRDSHGNFQFSQLPTEQILIKLVKDRLHALQKKGKYSIGIDRNYYFKITRKWDIDGNICGPLLFSNWTSNKKLFFKSEITSEKKMLEVLVNANVISKGRFPSNFISTIFKKSIPNFKTQTHFYGYVGRGESPSNFDCTYAYNLGKTAFHLLNNGATGQMASIMNLHDNPKKWNPIGIPLILLMNLEERKGKLSLVLGKRMVDLKSPAFRVFKALRKKWLSLNSDTEHYRRVISMRSIEEEQERPITMLINKISGLNTKGKTLK